jgi:SM-20-related protein
MDLALQRFESVVQQILEQGRAIVEGLFPDQILSDLLLHLDHLREEDALRPAAIGPAGQTAVHAEIRSDQIRWWPSDPVHSTQLAYLAIIHDLVAYLNRTCFTGIQSSEFMYAAYPPGAFYARHLDDFQNKNARKFSVITYLNRNWQAEDGGELLAHGNTIESIAPLFGRTVIFPSDTLEHEVLPTHKERLSVTGWLR